jgi:hypothetical protein
MIGALAGITPFASIEPEAQEKYQLETWWEYICRIKVENGLVVEVIIAVITLVQE